jgi:hypothetical protein
MNKTSFATVLLAVMLTGCRSKVVKVNLINTSSQPVSTIIVDYPSATFGKNKLAPGETFSYAIKPLDSGAIKVQFTSAKGDTHTYVGPTLHKNDDGSINLKFDQDSARAETNVASH